jgi:ribosomal protein L30E
MEYYSAIKKNEIMLFAGKLLELGSIMLREVSQI